MGKYRDRMARISAMPPDLLAADMADELDGKIEAVQKTIQTMQDQIYILDQKVTACCDDAALKREVLSLRAELEAVRGELANLKPTPTP